MFNQINQIECHVVFIAHGYVVFMRRLMDNMNLQMCKKLKRVRAQMESHMKPILISNDCD